jgi:hypothetical protein
VSPRRLIALLALALPLAFAAPAHAYVYWADFSAGTIGRADLDGTQVNDAFIHVGGNPVGVAVDAAHIYWADESGGTIGRAKIDGTVVEPNFITGINKPFGVAVNGTSIFWPSLGSDEIGRANLDGSGKKLNFVANAESPCSIALDGGHVYWAGVGATGHIGRASLTGSSPEPEWISLGTTVPCGLAVNSANVFFANTGFLGSSSHEIGRANINGTAVDHSLIASAEGPCGLAIFDGHLYWANEGNGTIGRANTDGTGEDEELIKTGAAEICGVAVDALATPVTPPGEEEKPGNGEESTPPTGTPTGQTPTPGPNLAPGPSPNPPPAGQIQIQKVKGDTKHGTARVTLAVNEAGVLAVSGKGIATARAQAAGVGTVTVTLHAAKKQRATLNKAHKFATNITASFTPTNGGAAATAVGKVTLRLTATTPRRTPKH